MSWRVFLLFFFFAPVVLEHDWWRTSNIKGLWWSPVTLNLLSLRSTWLKEDWNCRLMVHMGHFHNSGMKGYKLLWQCLIMLLLSWVFLFLNIKTAGVVCVCMCVCVCVCGERFVWGMKHSNKGSHCVDNNLNLRHRGPHKSNFTVFLQKSTCILLMCYVLFFKTIPSAPCKTQMAFSQCRWLLSIGKFGRAGAFCIAVCRSNTKLTQKNTENEASLWKRGVKTMKNSVFHQSLTFF